MKILFEGISIDDFQNQLREIIKEEVTLLTSPNNTVNDFMTRKETMKFLDCSSPTLIAYQKKGLPYYRIGRTIKFKQSEISTFLKVTNLKNDLK